MPHKNPVGNHLKFHSRPLVSTSEQFLFNTAPSFLLSLESSTLALDPSHALAKWKSANLSQNGKTPKYGSWKFKPNCFGLFGPWPSSGDQEFMVCKDVPCHPRLLPRQRADWPNLAEGTSQLIFLSIRKYPAHKGLHFLQLLLIGHPETLQARCSASCDPKQFCCKP